MQEKMKGNHLKVLEIEMKKLLEKTRLCCITVTNEQAKRVGDNIKHIFMI